MDETASAPLSCCCIRDIRPGITDAEPEPISAAAMQWQAWLFELNRRIRFPSASKDRQPAIMILTESSVAAKMAMIRAAVKAPLRTEETRDAWAGLIAMPGREVRKVGRREICRISLPQKLLISRQAHAVSRMSRFRSTLLVLLSWGLAASLFA